MTDWGDLYRRQVAAVSVLAAGLSEEELRASVPGTPAWTVHDVLAHLAGCCSDSVTGRMDGAPSPEWTSRHVSERAELPVSDLVTELQTHQDAVADTTVDDPRPVIVWDMAVHVADLHEALGLGEPPEHLWRPVLGAASSGRFAATGVVPHGIEPYELFRAIFSRRSRSQMQAWGLPLSAEQLDDVCVFGPREDDQPAPV